MLQVDRDRLVATCGEAEPTEHAGAERARLIERQRDGFVCLRRDDRVQGHDHLGAVRRAAAERQLPDPRAVQRRAQKQQWHVGRQRNRRAPGDRNREGLVVAWLDGRCGRQRPHRCHALHAGARRRTAGATIELREHVADRRVSEVVARARRAVGRICALRFGLVRRVESLVPVPPAQVTDLGMQREAGGRIGGSHYRAGALLYPHAGGFVERPQRHDVAGLHGAAVEQHVGEAGNVDARAAARRQLQWRAALGQHELDRPVTHERGAAGIGTQALEPPWKRVQRRPAHIDRREAGLDGPADRRTGTVDQRPGSEVQPRAV